MQLENIVLDAVDPQRLGRFWEGALGTRTLTDAPDIYETRLEVSGGPVLDLCFQPVPDRAARHPRLHLDLSPAGGQAETVERLVALGAQHADIGQGDVPWVVLADPEGNRFCVLEERPLLAATGPLACLPLHSADPDRDAEFWSWLTGWIDVPGYAPRSLRHPSRLGVLLELVPEVSPKDGTKNRLHLDVRLDPGEDADEVEARILEHGGARFDPGWGDLPWRSYVDPSGNEFCVLPVSSG